MKKNYNNDIYKMYEKEVKNKIVTVQGESIILIKSLVNKGNDR